MTPPFATVLVANRGEIACRIIRTLRELGIRSVAIHSDADASARHVREADVSVRIGPAAAALSYLDADAVIAAAVASGAQAVHPGYGFLSENAAFARACADAGIAFIGPGADAIEIMGDKVRAKAHVEARGVPVIAGSGGEGAHGTGADGTGTDGTVSGRSGLTDEQLVAAASRIGYPLLIKPSAGGGGKGMHVVSRAEELAPALASARRLAQGAFGDDTLLLEALVDRPRHIEVQVLADRFGRVIHLGERECSLQRRHQKVIEEAPSPLLDTATRERIGLAACEVARSVGYEGAGTVEFLVSASDPAAFFFLEMNTRLQVEHPVTELVTGLDLVAWQLRIAAGLPLTLSQADVTISGHSVEARVYAEDPRQEFLPGAGTVLALAEPRLSPAGGVRIDGSLLVGTVVPPDYDPMLAKVIVWGADRAQALDRLDAALAATVVLGVPTNLEYLRLLLDEPEVRTGELDTGLIERRLPHLAFADPDFAALATAALILHESDTPAATVWTTHPGWRLGDHRASSYRLVGARGMSTVEVAGETGERGERGNPRESGYRVVLGEQRDTATLTTPSPGHHLVRVGSLSQAYRSAREPGGALWLARGGVTWRFDVPGRSAVIAARREAARSSAGGPGEVSPVVVSPMPGTVVAVHVASGAPVAAGDPILSVEAMKMEHQVRAPLAGTVLLAVAVGDVVRAGGKLATVTPAEPPLVKPSPAQADPPTVPAPHPPTPEEIP